MHGRSIGRPSRLTQEGGTSANWERNLTKAGVDWKFSEAPIFYGLYTALIALGAGGTVGGGSTITKDTAPGALTVARAKQVSTGNWQRPQKKK